MPVPFGAQFDVTNKFLPVEAAIKITDSVSNFVREDLPPYSALRWAGTVEDDLATIHSEISTLEMKSIEDIRGYRDKLLSSKYPTLRAKPAIEGQTIMLPNPVIAFLDMVLSLCNQFQPPETRPSVNSIVLGALGLLDNAHTFTGYFDDIMDMAGRINSDAFFAHLNEYIKLTRKTLGYATIPNPPPPVRQELPAPTPTIPFQQI